MNADQVLAWLESQGSDEGRHDLLRYGIPIDRALGVPMRALKEKARQLGSSHELAAELWESGWYEARTLAAFVEEPGRVTPEQMDRWAHDFDSWAICDTVCYQLFDKTPDAWHMIAGWAEAPEEFVRRSAFALVWALALHDKSAGDEVFIEALQLLRDTRPDSRPLVKKAMDMALRAIGKRNPQLRGEAKRVARQMAESADKDQAWVGKHAFRELTKPAKAAR